MDYIEKLNLDLKEIKEIELLEKHTIINNEPFTVAKFVGHDRDFLVIGSTYDDGFIQLKEIKTLQEIIRLQ